jgi:hypothetical protein
MGPDAGSTGPAGRDLSAMDVQTRAWYMRGVGRLAVVPEQGGPRTAGAPAARPGRVRW